MTDREKADKELILSVIIIVVGFAAFSLALVLIS